MTLETTATPHRLRLKNIKLVGFKSFVDPTTVPFPSNLVGIVGPNGCGKSNIIDAVRWVMGESSAKSLRAEAGIDVIFNGSTLRKPVGQASIELTFDNPHGAIGGEYANYSEISIKRSITRDGISTYFLNNVRCRRRDITHIFLGTGMGPRSYAIIEQGMISEFVGAKPEELRVYLEEAAGISKYKERRRETENRIKNTRENLDRLDDLRQELQKQLNRLARQSEAALQFKLLKEEENRFRVQLLVIRWQQLTNQISTLTQSLQNLAIALESEVAKQRHADSQIEKIRDAFHDAQDAYQAVQEKFYALNAQIARCEQSIAHQKERQAQLNQDLHEAKAHHLQAEQHVKEDTTEITALEAEILRLQPALEALEAQLDVSQGLLQTAEENMHVWQAEWDDFNHSAAKASEAAQVAQTQLGHSEQQIHAAKDRLLKLQQDESQVRAELNPDDLLTLSAMIEEYTVLESEKQQQLTHLQSAIQSTREEIKAKTDILATLQSSLQQSLGKQASLEALQQAALGKNNDKIAEWLESHQLSHAKRLAETIQVEAGWEVAVETVLGHHLQAVCLPEITSIVDILASFTEGELSFIFQNTQERFSHSPTLSLTPLSHKLSGHFAAAHLLESIYTCSSLQEAVQYLPLLAQHESIVTPEGIWLSQTWLKVAKDKSEDTGILKREQMLVALQSTIDNLHTSILETEQVLSLLTAELQSQEEALSKDSFAFREFIQAFSNLKAELQVKTARQEQIKHRLLQLAQEQEEQQMTLKQATAFLHEIRGVWQEALSLMEAQSDERAQLMSKRENYKAALEMTRLTSREDKEKYHEAQLKFRTMTTALESKRNNVTRMLNQLEQLNERCQHLQETLLQFDEPLAATSLELDDLLERRLSMDEVVAEKRIDLENCTTHLKEQEQIRQTAEKQADIIRQQHQTLSMQWQEYQVRAKTIREQLETDGENLETIQQTLPEAADEKTWEAELNALSLKISKLGLINLAAIDEFQTESERKIYLDKQYDDLMEAINTLEAAIQKIDKETRAKFKEIYEIVNEHFMQLFPKIFGGGSAYLALTSEDLLEAGISVMARPPGKKNSTIHLLSGGEKALTAIALVFSIFQINPAPFCMLDEVDAPLDDANVSRYCELIKEMSKQVQFIFISHNKVAIEMAEQLTGVTMKEPGVSRLVAVDIEQAIAMATA